MNTQTRPIRIIYRAADSAAAERLCGRLRMQFGREVICQNPGTAEPNSDTRSTLAWHASDFIVMVVIGPSWTTARNASGHLSLHDPQDPVRRALEAALRTGVRVLPVLVTGARLPEITDLPVSVRPLMLRSAIRITPEHFDDDVRTLINRLSHDAGYRTDRQTGSGDTEIWPVGAGVMTGGSAPVLSPAWRPQPVSLPPASQDSRATNEAYQNQSSGQQRAGKAPRGFARSLHGAKLTRPALTALFSLASIAIATVAIVIHITSSPTPRPPPSRANSFTHRTTRPMRCSPSPPPANLTPEEVVMTLYKDINRHSFCAAWNLGANSIQPGETYAHYVAGFKHFRKDRLTVTAESGSNPATVYVSLEAFNRNTPPVTYSGYYRVANGKIAGGVLHRTGTS